MNNKGQVALVLAIIFGIIIVIGAFVLISNSGTSSGNTIQDNLGSNCRQIETPYEEQEEYYETVPYIDKECQSKELMYNIGDIETTLGGTPFIEGGCFKKEEECIKYILGVCTEKREYCVGKRIDCTVKVNNLDNEKGYWSFKFDIKEGDTSEIVETLNAGSTILTQDSQEFWVTETFEGREDAEKSYYCTIDNMQVPTKQICSDVTKYQDVLRTRTITKYKTETICE